MQTINNIPSSSARTTWKPQPVIDSEAEESRKQSINLNRWIAARGQPYNVGQHEEFTTELQKKFAQRMQTMSDFTQPGATQALLPLSAKMLLNRDKNVAA